MDSTNERQLYDEKSFSISFQSSKTTSIACRIEQIQFMSTTSKNSCLGAQRLHVVSLPQLAAVFRRASSCCFIPACSPSMWSQQSLRQGRACAVRWAAEQDSLQLFLTCMIKPSGLSLLPCNHQPRLKMAIDCRRRSMRRRQPRTQRRPRPRRQKARSWHSSGTSLTGHLICLYSLPFEGPFSLSWTSSMRTQAQPLVQLPRSSSFLCSYSFSSYPRYVSCLPFHDMYIVPFLSSKEKKGGGGGIDC